jgi:hypothetical protein
MAITNYAELKAAIVDRSHRPDLASRVPDFIRMAEIEINRRLTIFPKETATGLTMAAAARTVALPLDYDSPVELTCEGAELLLVTSAQLPPQPTAATPKYWAVAGHNIEFDSIADRTYALTLRYLQTVYLSDANPTNDLFARAPDLYFYGAMAELADWRRDDRDLAMYTARFQSLLRSVAADAARSKGAAPLQTEIPSSLLCSSSTRRNWGH